MEPTIWDQIGLGDGNTAEPVSDETPLQNPTKTPATPTAPPSLEPVAPDLVSDSAPTVWDKIGLSPVTPQEIDSFGDLQEHRQEVKLEKLNQEIGDWAYERAREPIGDFDEFKTEFSELFPDARMPEDGKKLYEGMKEESGLWSMAKAHLATGREGGKRDDWFDQWYDKIKPEQRERYLSILSQTAKDNPRTEFGNQPTEALSRGIEQVMQMPQKLLKSWGKYDDDPEKKAALDFYYAAESIRQGGDPLKGRPTGVPALDLVQEGALGAIGMAPSMYVGGQLGAAGGGAAKVLGAGAKLQKAASVASGGSFWAGQEYPDIYEDIVRNGGSERTAHTTAAIASPIIAAIEYAQVQTLGKGFKAGDVAKKRVKQKVKAWVVESLKDYGQEVGEESAQAIVGSVSKKLADFLDKDLHIDNQQEIDSIVEQTRSALISMPFLQGPSATMRAGQAMQEGEMERARLQVLPEIRAAIQEQRTTRKEMVAGREQAEAARVEEQRKAGLQEQARATLTNQQTAQEWALENRDAALALAGSRGNASDFQKAGLPDLGGEEGSKQIRRQFRQWVGESLQPPSPSDITSKAPSPTEPPSGQPPVGEDQPGGDAVTLEQEATNLKQRMDRFERENRDEYGSWKTAKAEKEFGQMQQQLDEYDAKIDAQAEPVGEAAPSGQAGQAEPVGEAQPGSGPAVTHDATPDVDLSNKIAQRLQADAETFGREGQPGIKDDEFFKMADESYGGTRAEGKYGPSDAYDALELGINRFLERKTDPTVSSAAEAKKEIQWLEGLTNRIPKQKNRSGEKDEKQQFSTPPAYAFAVNWLANIKEGDVVVEPSAGTGSLAIHAINAGAKVYGNEYSERRANQLRSLPVENVFTEDAAFLDSTVGDSLPQKPTTIVMNPPFSRDARLGNRKKTIGMDRTHIDAALRVLEDGGRAVIIMGAGLHGKSKGVTKWLSELPYDVRADVEVGRQVYGAYGTTFPTRILVIDKVARSKETVEGSVETLPELVDLLEGVRNDRAGKTGGESVKKDEGADSPGPAGDTATGPKDSGTGAKPPGRKRVGDKKRSPVDKPGDVETPDPGSGTKPKRIGDGSGAGGTGTDSGGSVSAGEPSGPGQPDANRPSIDTLSEDELARKIEEGLLGKKEDAEPPKKTGLKKAKEKARQEFDDSLGELGDYLKENKLLSGVDPELVRIAAKVTAKGLKLGVYEFADLMSELSKKFGEEATERIRPSVAEAWNWVRDNLDPEGKMGQVTHKAKPAPKKELSDSTYEPYAVSIETPGAMPHPAPIVESAAMAAIPLPKTNVKIHIPEKVIKGYTNEDGVHVGISDVQLEAVALAAHSHNQILPDGKRRGFMIGDGTGVGKAREVAGIMQDNIAQGRKRHVWISMNDALSEAMEDEWVKVGGAKEDFFKHGNAAKSGHKFPDRDGVLYTTYGTLLTGASDKAKKAGHTLSRVDQIVDWLGEDFDGVIAFDESHKMGNANSTGEGRNQKKASGTAIAGLELQERLPLARIVYVSATSATEVRNLGYAPRLGLWGKGTAFADRDDFINKITAGGVAAMEKTAADMKALGMYVARNLSFDDGTKEGRVEYKRLEHTLTDDQEYAYDKMAEAWQIVLKNVAEAQKATGEDQTRNNANSIFWGANQRFWEAVITHMQTPAVIQGIEKDLAEGRSAVIQLTKTGQAQLERAVARRGKGESLDEVDVSPKGILIDYLMTSFPVNQFVDDVDGEGNPIKVPLMKKKLDSNGQVIKDKKGNPVMIPVINKEAEAIRDKLVEDVNFLPIANRAALDEIIDHFGSDQVAEITGRPWRLEPDENGENQVVTMGKAFKREDKNAFMDGRKRILIFSEAGGTGASYHADLTRDNQQKRMHYLLQPGWRAAIAIQGLGRTHRSNQAQAPEFVLVTTNLRGQMRFISTIARRLSQLGALTKGERRAGESGVFTAKDNLESPEARAALETFFKDVFNANVETVSIEDLEAVDLRIKNQDGSLSDSLPKMEQFLNRVLSMEVKKQNEVFEAFENLLDEKIQQAIDEGTLDQGLETVKADSIVKESEQQVYEHPSGATTNHVVVKVSNETNPRSWDSVQNARVTGYYLSDKTGKVQVAEQLMSVQQDKHGNMSHKVKLINPMSVSYSTVNLLQNAKNWHPITEAEAKKKWNEEVENAPAMATRTMHMLTGVLLPVWDKLPASQSQVRRMITDDGESLLGRIIPNSQVDKVLNSLGVRGKQADLQPDELVDKILGGGTVTLGNGWKLKKSRVGGEPRIELLGPDRRYADQLGKMGIIAERIGSVGRFFVPVGPQASDIISELIDDHGLEGASNAQKGTAPKTIGTKKDNVQQGQRAPEGKPSHWAKEKPETAGGEVLLSKLKEKNSSGEAIHGLRTISEFVVDLSEAELFVGKSQLSRRNPAHYMGRKNRKNLEKRHVLYHYIRSRSPYSHLNYHEAGHAISTLLRLENAEFFSDHENELLALTGPDGYASAETAEEGFAELVRKYVSDYDKLDPALVAAFEATMKKHGLTKILKGLRDAHRAYSYHRSRPAIEQMQSLTNDRKGKGKRLGELAKGLADDLGSLYYSLAFRLVGGDWMVLKLRRQGYKAIKAGANRKSAVKLLKDMDNTTSDIGAAYQSTLRIPAESMKALLQKGGSLEILQTGAGFASLTEEEENALRDAGIHVPESTAHDNYVRLHDGSFADIQEKLGDEWGGFVAYGQHKAALERWHKKGHEFPGMTEGLTPHKVADWIREEERKHPEWIDYHAEVTDFMNQLLLIPLASGEMTAAEVVRIANAWENYWPLIRQQDDKKGLADTADATDPNVGVREAFGSDLAFKTLEEAVGYRVRRAMSAYYTNRMIFALHDFARDIGSSELGNFDMQKAVERTLIPLKMDTEVGIRMTGMEEATIVAENLNRFRAEQLGLTVEELPPEEKLNPEDINIATPGRIIWRKTAPKMVNVISGYQDGRRRYFQVTDPNWFELLARSRRPGPFVKWVEDGFVGMNAPWRRAITQNVVFALWQLSRDPGTAVVNGDDWIFGSSLVMGALNQLKRGLKKHGVDLGEDVETHSQAELLSRTLNHTASQEHATAVERFVAMLGEGITDQGFRDATPAQKAALIPGITMSTALKPIDVFNYLSGGRALSARTETLSREGALVKEKAKGASDARAQMAFERVTGNFGQRGGDPTAAAIIRSAGFANPSLQVMFGMYGKWMDPTTGWNHALKLPALAMQAAAAAYVMHLLMAAFYDDDELEEVYKNLRARKDEDRMRYMSLGGVIRAPFDYGPSGAAMSLGWNTVEGYLIDDNVENREAAKAAMERLFENPAGDLNFLPPMVKVAHELSMNYSTFFDESIVPDYMKDDVPELQKYASTPKTYQAAGQALGVSPLKVQYFVRNALSSQLDSWIDWAESDDKTVGKFVKEGPMTNRMFTKESRGWRSQDVQDLREIKEKWHDVLDLADSAATKGNSEKAKQLRAELPGMYEQYEFSKIIDQIWRKAKESRDSGDAKGQEKIEREMSDLAFDYGRYRATGEASPALRKQFSKIAASALEEVALASGYPLKDGPDKDKWLSDAKITEQWIEENRGKPWVESKLKELRREKRVRDILAGKGRPRKPSSDPEKYGTMAERMEKWLFTRRVARKYFN